MPSTRNSIEFVDPPAGFVTALGAFDLHRLTLHVSESTLLEIAAVGLEHDLTFSVSPDGDGPTSGEVGSAHQKARSHPGDSSITSRDGERERSVPSATAEPNGGQLTPRGGPGVEPDRVPGREEFLTTADWLASTAESLGVDIGALQEIIHTHSKDVDAEQIRRTLELVFAQHLERASKGEHAFVDIRFGNPHTGTRYRYLDNGPGRGGAHLFERLNGQQKVDVIHIAASEGLDVLAEGDGFVSVSYGHPATTDDVRFAEQVISEVFDASLAAVVRIEETIDREESRTWLG